MNTQTLQPPHARCSVSRAIPAPRESNPILNAAVRCGAVATIFPTQLSKSEAEQSGLYPGYYLRAGDGMNYWIGSKQDEARGNLAFATNWFLKESFQFDFDLEYSFGHVVGGGTPWANLSLMDEFI